MSLLDAFAAAGLIAALAYVVDRGIAFHVCLYAAIASGGRFKAEEAYRAMENPFGRTPRLVLWGAITLSSFVLGALSSFGHSWTIAVAVAAVALAYCAVSTTYAFRAFRQTEYGAVVSDAVEQGRWRDDS